MSRHPNWDVRSRNWLICSSKGYSRLNIFRRCSLGLMGFPQFDAQLPLSSGIFAKQRALDRSSIDWGIPPTTPVANSSFALAADGGRKIRVGPVPTWVRAAFGLGAFGQVPIEDFRKGPVGAIGRHFSNPFQETPVTFPGLWCLYRGGTSASPCANLTIVSRAAAMMSASNGLELPLRLALFEVTNLTNEVGASNAAKSKCEQASGRTCTRDSRADVLGCCCQSCKYPGTAPVSIVSGSGQGLAMGVALAKAYDAGFRPICMM